MAVFLRYGAHVLKYAPLRYSEANHSRRFIPAWSRPEHDLF